MRRLLATLLDVAAVALGGYFLFRLAEDITPCGVSGTCPLLAPLTAGLLVLLIVVYFGAAHVLWHRTLGEQLFLR
jgi:hypothetical protein